MVKRTCKGGEHGREDMNTTVLTVIALCLYSKTYLHLQIFYIHLHCRFHSN